MWDPQIPGFKLPQAVTDKTPPPKAVETVAGIGLGVFLVGLVVSILVFHALHVLNGFTWAISIVVPATAAALTVRFLMTAVLKLSKTPLDDRAAYPRQWKNPASWWPR